MDSFICSLSWLSQPGGGGGGTSADNCSDFDQQNGYEIMRTKSASVRNKVYELKSLAIPLNAKTQYGNRQ